MGMGCTAYLGACTVLGVGDSGSPQREEAADGSCRENGLRGQAANGRGRPGGEPRWHIGRSRVLGDHRACSQEHLLRGRAFGFLRQEMLCGPSTN